MAAREQQQAAWAKVEEPHWKAAMAAAVGASAAGTTVAVPLLLAGAASPAPESDELAALMSGRLDLPALQRLTRPPGLAVFCSSTVRECHWGSPPSSSLGGRSGQPILHDNYFFELSADAWFLVPPSPLRSLVRARGLVVATIDL